MANFPPYQYQPQMAFGQQPMYQFQQYQQPMQNQQAEPPLFCRMATNREEVVAAPPDYSARPMTFLGPQLQTIWVKVFNPSTGGSDVAEYHRAGTEAPKDQPAYLTAADLEPILDALRKQGDEIAQLRGRRRAAKEDSDEI